MTAQAASPNTPQHGTFSALRSSNFRLYFTGQLISTAGTWMQNLAQAALVVSLIIASTHSPEQASLWLGIVACAAGLPLVLLAPIAGVIIERFPRRSIMLVTQTTQMILAFILAALAFANAVQVWEVVILSFLLGLTNALDTPSRQAFIVEMVGREDLQSGIQLNSILVSASRAIGPAAAAIALASVGVAWCFLLNGLSFLAVIASLAIMKVPHAIPPSKGAAPLRQIREGLNYVVNDGGPILPMLLLVAVVGSFVLPINGFFAAFAAISLNSADVGYAALAVAVGVGSVVAGAVVGWVTGKVGRGMLIASMVLLTGPFYIALTAQHNIPIATGNAFIVGVLSLFEIINLNTGIQFLVPNQFRGRVLALYSLAFFGLSPFAALILGFLASGIGGFAGIGTANAMAVYGLISVVFGAAIVMRWPEVLKVGARQGQPIGKTSRAATIGRDAVAEVEAIADPANTLATNPISAMLNVDTPLQTPAASDR